MRGRKKERGRGRGEKKNTPARYYWGIHIFTKFLRESSKKILVKKFFSKFCNSEKYFSLIFSILLYTNKWKNGQKRNDFSRNSFHGILVNYTNKLWNGRKRLDLLARFSFTSI